MAVQNPFLLLCFTAFLFSCSLNAQEPQAAASDLFTSHIRTTEPLNPQEAMESFILPNGFEIQLVAAEPDIAKPTNMAIDAQGRVWVTSTEEYPYAAPLDRQETKDSIKILEDIDGDGSADKITTFADNLNIPMGLYPYRDGVVCFSIPNIWFLRDTDGDDRCDRREILYGPIGYERDTHGMVNSFTRGYDGWLYACHGFNNETIVAGTDGHEIGMRSGNIFRMRLDGSRLELFTHGHVNPYGLTFNKHGDLLVADCHTKPISLLVRGGYQDSFGKPHDGLGYIPALMKHNHGSTAICGIVLGESTAFPAEYRDSVFSGNVTSCRINRNTLHYRGSSPQVLEEPDFLISKDPWFRPVDLQVGLDGALYVADFYNRIIGHYEVDLDDPGRDRHRGRIWKIVHRDQSQAFPDLTKASLETLTYQLASENDTLAARAFEQVGRRFPHERATVATQLLRRNKSSAIVRGLWMLERAQALTDSLIVQLAGAPDSRVREHLFRLLQERHDAPAKLIMTGFDDAVARVCRAAVMAASVHPDPAMFKALLDLLANTSKQDSQLHYAARMALRNLLRDHEGVLRAAELTESEILQIAGVCLSLKSRKAAQFLVNHLDVLSKVNTEQLNAWLQFAVSEAESASLEKIARLVQQRFYGQSEIQLGLLRSIRQGLRDRGQGVPAVIVQWATQLATHLLGDVEASPSLAWRHTSGKPWVVSVKRRCDDGPDPVPMWSSFPAGETKTGVFQSAPFALTESFSFYLGGHDGPPSAPIQGKNVLRLRDAITRAVIHETAPPRTDVAQLVTWDTNADLGKEAIVELVDGDTGKAFAWMCVGRFSVPGLNPSGLDEDRKLAAELIGLYGLTDFRLVLGKLLRGGGRSELMHTLAKVMADMAQPIQRSVMRAAAEALMVEGLDERYRQELAEGLEISDGWRGIATVTFALPLANAAQQQAIASALCQDMRGLRFLFPLIKGGSLSARVLKHPTVDQAIRAIASNEQKALAATLTANLGDHNEALKELIAARKASIGDQQGDPTDGRVLFRQFCMTCHQLGDEGQNLGPNLDGIGNRGLERVVEDILDPNRNVDVAFRVTSLVLQDQSTVSGFIRSENEKHVTLADVAGKEQRIAIDQITERLPSEYSLMPATFAESLTETQFRNLMAWLLAQR
jgi:putative membrane-bound dehydrogenase-like protein